MAELKVLFEKIITCLDRSKLPYAIVGGFAAILRGRARTTTDIDVVINASVEEVLILLDCLSRCGLEVIKGQALLALQEGTNLSVFDTNSYARLDLKRARTDDEREVVRTAKNEQYEKLSIRVATIEEILYGKVIYIGPIDDLNDDEMLNYTDVVDFLVLYHQYKHKLDREWLKRKAETAGLGMTVKRLVNFDPGKEST